jgi:two-component system, chemotaxis family, sensor kinase CheA
VAADPLRYFRIESRELVEQLGAGALELEREGADAAVVARLLRAAHTLKGAARVVKQQAIAKLAHEVEDLLAPLRERPGPVARERLEGVLALVDRIGTAVRGLAPPRAETARPAADESFRTLRTDVAEMDALLAGIAETQTRVGALGRTADALAQARRLASVIADDLGAAPVAARGKAAAAAEELRGLLSDMERGLAGDAERIERELREVRTTGERLRLLPVSALFGPLERTARDAAHDVGKRARFRGSGGDVRVDGQVLGALQAALVQIVRNAVAHGIEGEAERLAAGKPVEGSIVLEVARRGSRVAFVCRDDGRGIDVAAVRRALERKGVLPDGTDDSSPDELLRLLLVGGISTAHVVTDVSGRGVGLDVVRETAARLGAQVAIRTRPGTETTVEIVVPVSLASVDALIVDAGGARAAVPMDAVITTVRLGRGDVTHLPGGDAIPYQGALVPFVALPRLLARGDAEGDPHGAWTAIVLASPGGAAAIGVDRLRDATTVLVRALPAWAPADPVVAGVSIDREGNPQPVLDPERLAEAVRRVERQAPRPAVSRPPILVVDDSLTTRMLEQSILESAGYSVELATSGEEALEKARRHSYGLFLVDVEMPGMDGFELLERLQADPDLRQVPAILVTSRNAVEDRSRGAQAGARAYVVKSEFDQVDLLRRIESLMP